MRGRYAAGDAQAFLAARMRSNPALVVTMRKWIAAPVSRTSAMSRAIAIVSAHDGAAGKPEPAVAVSL